MFEIYVHSRLLEGIHLRGGKVARGGIRWSDRHDDFRTEVLGLMKTQMVKNAIIVPVGSKGGFVLKGNVPRAPGARRLPGRPLPRVRVGLLDVTDNIVDGKVCIRPRSCATTADDPYLVVAADKGTAHLSTPPTASRRSTASGWATPSPPAAASATTTRRWASPRAAPGSASSTTSATWATTCRASRSPWPASATWPATCSATARCRAGHQAGGRLQPRHIFIDPSPTREELRRARAPLPLPRSTWRDYDAVAHQQGRRDLRPLGQGHPALARDARAARTSTPRRPRRGGHPPHPARARGPALQRRHRHLREGLRRGRRRGRATAPTTACAWTARRCARAWWPRAATWASRSAAALEYWPRAALNTDAVDNSGGVDMSDHEVNIKILMDLLVKKGA
jgi:glutamate dehydrogenase